MTARPEHLPERLARISEMQAAEFISSGLLAGREDVPSIALNKVAEPLEGDDERGRLHPVRDLIEAAFQEFRGSRPTAADAWLAPRLHATLRLSRREAADAGLWSYLALGVAPDYVVWRWRPEEKGGEAPPKVARKRFLGPHHTQAFARLWWAAELFRDGPDYGPVVRACANQDMLNTTLRLDIIDHRPTAQALVRLMDRKIVQTGREVNALVSAVNASAATLMYDVIAPDVRYDAEPLTDWIAAAETAPAVSRKDLPEGPEEAVAPVDAVESLAAHFEGLFADVLVRGRTSDEEG
ncbi:DUF6339 family protein [Streptomyces sp. NPDC102364]|uniref:DUF6339 family protein n=1 Tax=Streptomyces sp. NPDC102364 TaxID=3366161 RepID=UPI0037FB3C24